MFSQTASAKHKATPYWPAVSDDFQRAEIERIKKADPGYALVFDVPMDGREELKYSNSHPLIDNYIRTHFEAFPNTVSTALLTYKSVDVDSSR